MDFDGTRDHIVHTCANSKCWPLPLRLMPSGLYPWYYLHSVKWTCSTCHQTPLIRSLWNLISSSKIVQPCTKTFQKNWPTSIRQVSTSSQSFYGLCGWSRSWLFGDWTCPISNPMNYLDVVLGWLTAFGRLFWRNQQGAVLLVYGCPALHNIRIDIICIIKMLMITSAHAGSGKSTCDSFS